MNRRTSGGASTGGNRPRRIPQFPQKKPPTPQPTTPVQPGAPPSPPIAPPLALGVLGAMALSALWSWLNQRPPLSPAPPWGDGTEVIETFPSPRVVRVSGGWTVTGNVTRCDNGQSRDISFGGSFPAIQASGVSSVRVENGGDRSASGGCGGVWGIGGPHGEVQLLGPGGNVLAAGVISNGGASVNGEAGSMVRKHTITVTEGLGGPELFRPGGNEPQWGDPATEPQIQATDLPEPATVPAVPVPAPLPPPLPAPLPAAVPLPRPSTSPGGAPSGSPGGSTGGAPALVPTAPGLVTQAPPQTTPLTPTGPAPIAPPVKAPITPLEGVVIGGELIGGPGSPPPPTMAGMAAELGRLEKKGELMLERSGPLAQIPDVIDAIADLVELLDSFDPGGSYSIRPACGTDANGDPLPPIEVPIQPGLGLAHAVTARLDAIAELIDHHKQLRQPICKGKPTGQPVTVTFVEADP